MVDKSRYGEVVWAKYQGFSYWPCYIYEPKYAPDNVRKMLRSKKGFYVVYFYGDGNFGLVDSSKILAWNDATEDMRKGNVVPGSNQRPFTGKLRESFIQGIKIAKEERARDPMDRCAWNHDNAESEVVRHAVASGRVKQSEAFNAEKVVLDVVNKKKREENLKIGMDNSSKTQVWRKSNTLSKNKKRKVPTSQVEVGKSYKANKTPKRLDDNFWEDSLNPTGQSTGRVQSDARDWRRKSVEPSARLNSEQTKNMPLGFFERDSRVMAADDRSGGDARKGGESSDNMHCPLRKPNRVATNIIVAGSQMHATVTKDHTNDAAFELVGGKYKSFPREGVRHDHELSTYRNFQEWNERASQGEDQPGVQESYTTLNRPNATPNSSEAVYTCNCCPAVATADACVQTGNIAEAYANIGKIQARFKRILQHKLPELWARKLFEIAKEDDQDCDRIMGIFKLVSEISTTQSILAKTKLPTATNYFRTVENAKIMKMANFLHSQLTDVAFGGETSDEDALSS